MMTTEGAVPIDVSVTFMAYDIKDYPLAEVHPNEIKAAPGKKLSDIALDAVLSGEVAIEDLRITPKALQDQATISRAAGRPRLGDNFERAAELVGVPQEVVMQTYEMLRPGRTKTREDLLACAALMRDTYKPERIAAFIEEAAAGI